MKPIIAFYIIVHEESGKFYIGSTCDLKRRIQEHKYNLKSRTHPNSNLQKLYDDDKELKLKFLHLECRTIEEANKLEDEALKKSSSDPNLLNFSIHSSGGNGIPRHPNKEEIVKKITSSRKKNWEQLSEEEKQRRLVLFKNVANTPECIEKRKFGFKEYINSTPIENRRPSKETIEKRKLSNTGKKRTDATKLKMSIAQKGKKRSDEIRFRLSEIRKKQYQEYGSYIRTPEIIEKLRKSNTGKKHSPETLAKLSVITKDRLSKLTPEERKHSPESKLKISQKNKGRVLSADHKRKMSEAKKRFLDSMSPEELRVYKDRLANSRKNKPVNV